ncbi:deoxyribodipyrimidine photo-lyase [Geosmithia morbida]|uniref:Deoxyribodipyrimidine photo-lyase n=1 Tax=Geosmithia morbida TaxID=1094350 RepID=A0A9P4YZM4_9HYPO|nr:deoxyribodipyrimidine photo-lyase [Geosmithia morbida]KAF4124990.1 deoxyribodipyrimidine photo-lyase [Geosmithia morbida]
MPSHAKRKSASPPNGHNTKKAKKIGGGTSSHQHHPLAEEAEEHGIVLRKYYPPEMSNARAQAYTDQELPRPIEELQAALEETAKERKAVKPDKAMVHWFKMDLRHADNTSLALASRRAQEAGVPLVCMYLVSPQDFEAHLLSPARVDFMLRSLAVLQRDVENLDIPLYVETVDKRNEVPDRVLELMGEWGANHLFCNMEYEVDELRREAYMVRDLSENGKSFEVVHDTCVVPPGSLHTGAGKQYAVYSPWFRAWLAHVHDNLGLLELREPPVANPKSARKDFAKLFGCTIPAPPKDKSFISDEQKKRMHSLWPSGEHEALARLETFCKRKIGEYADARNTPSADGTSCMSVHLASGTVSSRTCIRTARDRNTTKKLNGGKNGIANWIGEVAWRDFYRHVLVAWPHVCMNKPYKPAYSNIAWSYDREHFSAWCDGRTGFPIVDAAMRQLNSTGYMHNRCRMIVASFLSKDLLIDWRMGERYFMEHLVDGDFASNNGGWGFSASVGVDPQPYFRIFNPLLQSERFDRDGEYIRKWVPELANVEGNAIHEPYARGAGVEAKKAGYPEPIVEHRGCRERALGAYKNGLESGM